MRRDLALWATTNYAGDTYPRLRNLRVPWNRWDKELYRPGLLVAAALRTMLEDGLSPLAAAKHVTAPKADVLLALQLMRDADLALHEVIKEQHPDVNSGVTAAREKVHVHLESRALEDMLLAAAEGYKVPAGKGSRYTEVFGLCFGSVRRKRLRSHQEELRVNVGRIATQMRAKASASEVTPSSKSLSAQLEIGEQFFPHLEVIGDYHTHPFRSLENLKENTGWEYSRQDERSLEPHLDEVRSHEHAIPLFSLVVAVATGGKKGMSARRYASNVIQVAVGNLFFVIGAYRIRLDATYDRDVQLTLSAQVE